MVHSETLQMVWHISFSLCFAFAIAGPVARGLQVHEARQLPSGFVLTGAAPDDTILNLRIALTQSDADGLIRALMDVSTPFNPQYGQHLSKEQVSLFLIWLFRYCMLFQWDDISHQRMMILILMSV